MGYNRPFHGSTLFIGVDAAVFTIKTPCFCLIIAMGFCVGSAARGATSKDPDILAMVNAGLSELDNRSNASTSYSINLIYSGGAGEKALAGYASMKINHNPSAPVVVAGLAAAKRFVAGIRDPEIQHESDLNKAVYSAATSVLLFAEVDPDGYKSELRVLEQYFRAKRRPQGFYAYPGDSQGDISQTQYAILALWSLDRIGLKIDYNGVKSTVDWLLAVQDAGGGWPYRATIPPGGKRIQQNGVTPGLALAGGSALMIAADILKTWGIDSDEDDPKIPGLPKAVKIFRGDKQKENLLTARPKVDAGVILRAIEDCDRYLAEKSPDPSKGGPRWPYYQLYTLERYESFKELIRGDLGSPEAPWYDYGTAYLKGKKSGGGWPAGGFTTSSTSTSFALLFLTRSTREAINSLSSGSAIGGWSLPGDTSEVSVDGANIKAKPIATSVTDLLSVLEGDGADQLAGKSIPDNLQLAPPGKERNDQLDRLERLARGSQSWQARRVAMRLLAQSDDMDRVPTLIYGLDDPDSVVKIYARDGLRFISRRFDGFGLSRKPSEDEIFTVQRKWRQWFLTMRPEYIFLD